MSWWATFTGKRKVEDGDDRPTKRVRSEIGTKDQDARSDACSGRKQSLTSGDNRARGARASPDQTLEAVTRARRELRSAIHDMVGRPAASSLRERGQVPDNALSRSREATAPVQERQQPGNDRRQSPQPVGSSNRPGSGQSQPQGGTRPDERPPTSAPRPGNRPEGKAKIQVPTATFSNLLVVNIERSRMLELLEPVPASSRRSPVLDDEGEASVRAYRMARLAQSKREGELYALATTENLASDPFAQAMPLDFLDMLNRNRGEHAGLVQKQRELAQAEQDVAKLERGLDFKLRIEAERAIRRTEVDAPGFSSDQPDLIRARAGLRTVLARRDRIRQTLHEAISEHRPREMELYALAEPFLINRGWLRLRPTRRRSAAGSPPPLDRQPGQKRSRISPTRSRNSQTAARRPEYTVPGLQRHDRGTGPRAGSQSPGARPAQGAWREVRQLNDQLRDEVLQDLEINARCLDNAVDALDNFHVEYRDRLRDFTADREEGRIAGTRTDFDLYQLINRNERNHDIVKAHAEWERSKKHARDLDVLPAHLQTSDFGDHGDADYSASAIEEMIRSVDREAIDGWRTSAGMRQVVSPSRQRSSGEVSRVDYEGRSVRMEDSLSVAARDRARIRIDRYAEQQGGHSPGYEALTLRP